MKCFSLQQLPSLNFGVTAPRYGIFTTVFDIRAHDYFTVVRHPSIIENPPLGNFSPPSQLSISNVNLQFLSVTSPQLLSSLTTRWSSHDSLSKPESTFFQTSNSISFPYEEVIISTLSHTIISSYLYFYFIQIDVHLRFLSNHLTTPPSPPPYR
ncbi:hypothetical protein H9L39_11632 [Fusarium oxysporum f. sp. albedinis]|nr:hypothetical protein H9L39_11632 [Fusarium oxysporum f. sp. albedinis]